MLLRETCLMSMANKRVLTEVRPSIRRPRQRLCDKMSADTSCLCVCVCRRGATVLPPPLVLSLLWASPSSRPPEGTSAPSASTRCLRPGAASLPEGTTACHWW